MFYFKAATDPERVGAVYENLVNHNVREDLMRMSEIQQAASFDESEMPRFTLSSHQEQFDHLFNLLDKNDEASSDVWNLVRMLNTNKQIFMQILDLKSSSKDSQIDWKKVFEDESLYKQIYRQEIIMSLMEEDQEGMDKRVVVTDILGSTRDDVNLDQVEEA